MGRSSQFASTKVWRLEIEKGPFYWAFLIFWMEEILGERNRLGLGWIAVIVETFSGFAAIPTHQHHAFEQRRRGKTLFLEFVEHDVGDVIGRVVAHEIEQRERTHGMAAAELHRIVDVFDGADALSQGGKGADQKRNEQAVDDEAGAVGGAYRSFAHAMREGDRVFLDFFVGGDGTDHFDQFHNRNRIEEVETEKTVGPLGERGHFRDRQGRRVAGKNRVLRADFVERGPNFAFGRELLNDRINNKVAIFQVFEVGGATQTAANLIPVLGGKRAFIDQALQILVDGLQSFFQHRRVYFAHRDLATGSRGNLRDSRTHQAAPNHSYFFDRHRFFLRGIIANCRTTLWRRPNESPS